MKAFVSGATGFLGSHVVERLLLHGHEVQALARPSSDTRFLESTAARIVRGDVTDVASLKRAVAGCDTVIHTAAVVGEWQPWDEFYRVGVMGTRNMLDAAIAAGVRRFVHVSSIAVYGLQLHGRVVHEYDPYEHHPEPWNHYVREKVQSERLAFRYYERGAIEVTAVRPSVIWGSRDRAAFPRMSDLLKGPLAGVIGRGRNRIPSVSAPDVADVCLRAAAAPLAAGRAYNVSSAETHSQSELMRLIAGLIGVRAPRIHVPFGVAMKTAAALETAGHQLRRREPPPLTRFNLLIAASDTLVDATLAREQLGWVERQSVPEAIREAAAASRTPS